MRLLPEPAMKWVSHSPFRPKVIGLLDSQFNDVISQEKKEEIKLAHQKIERLAEIVKDQEQSFLTSLQMLTSLRTAILL
ncbi:MAG TPA: hypothetical protein DCE56_03015 [Cyanobacteria bacterium UBA8553]|nr:hypothetical protein [Cyanobacteria bacterium UBA8553]HAJ60809.1 hypothetical protein [Cyanobacteria bacterium UBA8543]